MFGLFVYAIFIVLFLVMKTPGGMGFWVFFIVTILLWVVATLLGSGRCVK